MNKTLRYGLAASLLIATAAPAFAASDMVGATTPGVPTATTARKTASEHHVAKNVKPMGSWNSTQASRTGPVTMPRSTRTTTAENASQHNVAEVVHPTATQSGVAGAVPSTRADRVTASTTAETASAHNVAKVGSSKTSD